MTIWLNKKLVGDLKCNVNFKKLIQILVCVQQATVKGKSVEMIMSPCVVIDCLIKYIRTNEQMKDKINLTRPTKETTKLSIKHTATESLLNSFMYAYLVYNPSMFDMLFSQKNKPKKNEEDNKTYKSMYNYFSLFKNSRNPFTICWLMEIMNIVTLKYNINDMNLDSQMKADYYTLLNNLLANCGQIMSNSFNIYFHNKKEYKLAFPPTIYELLWRYEFITFKSTLIDKSDKKYFSSISIKSSGGRN